MRVATEEDIQKYKRLAEELLEENDSVTLISAALKMMTKEPEISNVQLSDQSQLRVNKSKNFNHEQYKRRKESASQKGNNRTTKSARKYSSDSSGHKKNPILK